MASLGTKVATVNSASDLDQVPSKTTSDRPCYRHGTVLRVRCSLFVATDLLAIWCGALVALWIRFPEGLHIGRPPVALAEHIGIVGLYSVLIVLFCHTQRLYSSYQAFSGRKEMLAIFRALVLASMLLTCSLFLSGVKSTSRFVLGVTGVSAFVLMSGWRFLRRRSLERAVADGLTCHNVLIVGADRIAISVRDHLAKQRQLGFVVVGMVTADGKASGGNVVGTVQELRTLCRAYFVDEIIVCPHDRQVVKQVMAEARECEVGVRVIPEFYDGSLWGAPVDYLGEIPTLAVVQRRIPAVELQLKRALDIFVSATALVILSPLLLLLALVVKLDSRGRIFYGSQRVGKKGRVFSCYKFRTMVTDADKLKDKLQHLNERDGILFKIKNDPRLTRSGRMMRKYSLDELAQLWNVLRGDMSLVGPRPPLASEVKNYELEHLRRLNVAPGITGLWQVEARMSPSFDRYIELDLRYVENWSFRLDLNILCRTIAVVFAGTGA